MGVLDEAIREHLELQRRRGADPGAVARQETEALGSSDADGLPAADRHDQAHRDEARAESLPLPDAGPERELHQRGDQPHQPGDLSDPAQETAELDMRTVFDDAEQTHGPARELVERGDPVESDRLWLDRDSQPSGLLA
ncbi:MAG TPA: hypothetical protein VMB51_13970 [Solirubrobacteraceae bacterium]|nr:hypothetical protein [Solirubrobacteraceae bacterium]